MRFSIALGVATWCSISSQVQAQPFWRPRESAALDLESSTSLDMSMSPSRGGRERRSLKRRFAATDAVLGRSAPFVRTRTMRLTILVPSLPLPSRTQGARPSPKRRALLAARERRAARLRRVRRAAMPDRKNSKAPDYAVGYGRPPKASQFAAGKSGNPKGRPKGSRSVGAVLQDIIQQKIVVTENGKTRRIPALEVMLRRLANDAMRSDQRALKLLLSLLERYAEGAEGEVHLEQMLAEDRTILEQFLQGADGLVAAPTEERDDGSGSQ